MRDAAKSFGEVASPVAFKGAPDHTDGSEARGRGDTHGEVATFALDPLQLSRGRIDMLLRCNERRRDALPDLRDRRSQAANLRLRGIDGRAEARIDLATDIDENGKSLRHVLYLK